MKFLFKIKQKFFHLCLKIKKDFFLSRYAKKSRQLTGGKKLFLLSFDCDNPEDVAATKNILPFLLEKNIKASFAVPGEIFMQNPDFFKKLTREGREIVAHGWKRHSEIKEGAYVSTLFYDKLNDEELMNDISKGVAVLRSAGIELTGFRIPHFGHSNSKKELKRVYAILKHEGISYSSSTLPEFALINGPLFRNYGMIEMPVSPSYSNPLSVLDTYNYGFNHNPKFTFFDYFEEFSKTLNFFEGKGAVLNFYCDPSQACKMESWFNVIQLVSRSGYQFITLNHFYQIYKKDI